MWKCINSALSRCDQIFLSFCSCFFFLGAHYQPALAGTSFPVIHRVTEQLRLECTLWKTSSSHPPHPQAHPHPMPCLDKLKQVAQLSSNWVLNTSRNGGSTTPLGDLFKYDHFFLMFRTKFHVFPSLSIAYCPVMLPVKVWFTPSIRYLVNKIIFWSIKSLLIFSSQGWALPAFWASPHNTN